MKIVRYPHPALRYKARPLTAIDKQVQLHAGRMLELMTEARGLGLAATQVALPYQMLVLNLQADPDQPEQNMAFINPVILERKGGTLEEEEGCLSFPGLYARVRRARSVRVQAYNLKGELVEINTSDLPARVWLHEVDHLDGVLFIDKLGPIARLASRGAVKEFEREFRRAQERGEIPPDADLAQALEALAVQT